MTVKAVGRLIVNKLTLSFVIITSSFIIAVAGAVNGVTARNAISCSAIDASVVLTINMAASELVTARGVAVAAIVAAAIVVVVTIVITIVVATAITVVTATTRTMIAVVRI